MPNQYTHRPQHIEWLKSLGNRELLDHLYEVSQPDDYDNMHTLEGEWQFDQAKAELEHRLTEAGWLPKED